MPRINSKNMTPIPKYSDYGELLQKTAGLLRCINWAKKIAIDNRANFRDHISPFCHLDFADLP
jgi:hypothetical protein